MSRTWSGVLARLGVPTGDNRIIAPGDVSSRTLPLPLMWQPTTGDGHGGAVVVGSIDTVQVTGDMVLATGRMLETAPYEVYELLDAGVIGPSVDLDDVEYQMDDAERIVITRARISGATLVAIPAFADVSIDMDDCDPAEEDCSPISNYGSMLDDAVREAADKIWPIQHAMAASAAASLPPKAWFQRPDLDRLTPVTVSDSGRVFGHIAGWDTCHVGLPGCVTPPHSFAGYAYFHQASQVTAEGEELAVGTMVAGPRHADPQAAFHAAAQHYDDPSAAVAKVAAGEDEHGIWVAGWVPPGVSEEARQVFMSNPVSGDWRRVAGALELIAVCSVNSAGFPIPRAKVAFSLDAQRTLIAAGMQPVSGELSLSRHREDHKDPRAAWAWAEMEG